MANKTNGWDVKWQASGMRWKLAFGGEHWHLRLGAKYAGVVFLNGTHWIALPMKIGDTMIESDTLHDCARALVAAVNLDRTGR